MAEVRLCLMVSLHAHCQIPLKEEEGVELSLQSTLSAIRAACKSAGVSVSGSKQRCLDRLRGYIDKQNIALRSEVAQTVESEGVRVAEGQRLIKEPSEAERRLHELTLAIHALVQPLLEHERCWRQACENSLESRSCNPCREL